MNDYGYIILATICWFLAAIANACMDVVSHHYQQSIFCTPKHKRSYYDPSISWKNKYENGDYYLGRKRWFYGLLKVHVAFTDFWHFCKSSMIVLVVLSICFAFMTQIRPNVVEFFLILFVYGTIWNVTFVAFYKNILRK